MGDEGNEEDLALMARVARGDEDAFAKIVKKHQHAVLGTVAKMTNQSPDTRHRPTGLHKAQEIRRTLKTNRKIHDIPLHHHKESCF